ncbi:MAG: DMT family transporter [Anaerolineae bacterium]|nr:DMT family transporter [Anaerolineae bacterium]
MQPLTIITIVKGCMAVVLQAQMVSLLDRYIGTLESVFITYFSGGLLIAVLILIRQGGNLGTWRSAPWYAFGGGLVGLVIIGSISYTVPRLGAVVAFTIIVATQFILGATIDHFGLLGAALRPLDLSRLIGIAVLLLGVWLIIR